MRYIYLFVVLGITLLLVGGCVSTITMSKIASAEKLPCLLDDIEVTDLEGASNRTWRAYCKGKYYSCSATAPGDGTLRNVSCHEIR